MRILFLINNLGGGGAERVLVNLVNHMDYSKYDITVKTIFDVGVNRQFLNEKITYKSVFKKMPRGNSYIAKLLPSLLLNKIIIKEEYDIVIAYMHGMATKILSCSSSSAKKIAWLHVDMKHEKSLSRTFWNKKHIKKTFGKYNAIVGVSQTVIDSFEDLTGIKDRTYIKYNTNDISFIRDKSKELINDWMPNPNVINIYSIGRLVSQKGFDRLLIAHNELITKGIEYNLYIFGNGEEKERLKRYIKDNNLENTVFLMGFKDNPYKYISKLDLFVCSSRHEGLSTAMSEAFILGIPVLTTKCSGAEEIVGSNSEYGLLVENNTQGIQNGMEKLLTSNKLLNHYKEKSKERSSFFSVENTVMEVENLIDEVMNDKC